MGVTTSCETVGRAAEARRSLFIWLAIWLGLGCLLITGFVVDARVIVAIHPLHGSRMAGVLDHTVRWLGNGRFQIPALLLMVGVTFAVTRQLRHRVAIAAAWALLAFAVSGIAGGVLKALVGRARPWVDPPHPMAWQDHFRGDYQSFPSGDTTTAFAIAITLGYFLPSLRIPLLIMATIVAAGRVIVGVHHPSDVVAGAMLGLATGQWITRIARTRSRQGSTADA